MKSEKIIDKALIRCAMCIPINKFNLIPLKKFRKFKSEVIFLLKCNGYAKSSQKFLNLEKFINDAC